MPTRLRLWFTPAALAALLGSCGEKSDQQPGAPEPAAQSAAPVAPSVAAGSTAQGLPGFFTPRPGETWAYQVHRDLPPGTQLSDDDQLRSTDLPGGGYRLSFERRRICEGTRVAGDNDEQCTVMRLVEDGAPGGREFLDIGPGGMSARGWEPAGATDRELQLLSPGILLASPTMAGGQAWSAHGSGARQEFQFRVIERTKVTVPAGTYEAARLQMNSNREARAVRRTIWFAENVGIVREETIYYKDRTIEVRETAELTEWSVPPEDEAAEASPPPSEDEDEPDEQEADDSAAGEDEAAADPEVEEGDAAAPEEEATEENPAGEPAPNKSSEDDS